MNVELAVDDPTAFVHIWAPSSDGASGALLATIVGSVGTVAIQVDPDELLGDEVATVRLMLTKDGVYTVVEQRDGEATYTRVWAPAPIRESDEG